MINEYELEGETIPTHWCWFFFIGIVALLGNWIIMTIAVVMFALCIAEDIKINRNLSFDNREAINEVR